jgi:hypothetical protein
MRRVPHIDNVEVRRAVQRLSSGTTGIEAAIGSLNGSIADIASDVASIEGEIADLEAGAGINSRVESAECAEDIQAGQPVYKLPGLTTIGVARADTSGKRNAVGVALESKTAGFACRYALYGSLELEEWPVESISILTEPDLSEVVEGSGSANNASCVVGSDGCVYVGKVSTDMLKIASDLSGYTSITGLALYTYGITSNADGTKIYCIPGGNNTNNAVLYVYNVVTGNASSLGLFNSRKYGAASLANNGCIYAAPYYRTGYVLKVDTSDDSYSEVNVGESSVNLSFYGAVTGANGKVYFVPYSRGDVWVVDPSDDSISKVSTSAGIGKWVGGCDGGNGYIYFAPYNYNKFAKIRVSDNTYSELMSAPGGGAYKGCALGVDGRIYFAPFNATSIAVLDTSDDSLSYIAGYGGSGAYSAAISLEGGAKILFISSVLREPCLLLNLYEEVEAFSLVPGSNYYIGKTGDITPTPPSTGAVALLGNALTTEVLNVRIERPIIL